MTLALLPTRLLGLKTTANCEDSYLQHRRRRLSFDVLFSRLRENLNSKHNITDDIRRCLICILHTTHTHTHTNTPYRCVFVIRIVIISRYSWAGAKKWGQKIKKIPLLRKNFSMVFILIILLSVGIPSRTRYSCVVAVFFSSRASSRHDGLNFFVYAMMNSANIYNLCKT